MRGLLAPVEVRARAKLHGSRLFCAVRSSFDLQSAGRLFCVLARQDGQGSSRDRTTSASPTGISCVRQLEHPSCAMQVHRREIRDADSEGIQGFRERGRTLVELMSTAHVFGPVRPCALTLLISRRNRFASSVAVRHYPLQFPFESGDESGDEMARGMNRLNARAAATLTKRGRHADGGGLYLSVSDTGNKSWLFLFTIRGRRREMGLGPLRDVPLARARDLASEARRQVQAGIDPIAARDVPQAMTFGEAADAYIAAHEQSWKNEKHRYQWRSTLNNEAASLRSMLVSSIGTEDVLKVLQPIWAKKSETASRLRGRIETILDWAKVKGQRSGENPARWKGHLDHLLPERKRLARGHHAALAIDDVPAFVRRLRAIDGIAPRALEFLILTAARTNEVIGARWEEFDLAGRVWLVPGERMKAGRDHKVPLSTAALTVLATMAKLPMATHVFPGRRKGEALSNEAMRMLMRRMGSDVTPHGFRSSFRDWTSERTNFPREVAEMALAHTISDKVEAAYRRGDLFAKRMKMMETWAAFVEPRDTGDVVRLHRGA